MSVKGQEFPAYDSRGIQGMGLAYATSNRGACHLRGYTVASEVLGIPVKTDPLVTEGKPELVKAFQDATAAFDSAGLCIFTSFAWTPGRRAAAARRGLRATSSRWTSSNQIGERIWNMERDFNNRAGFTGKDDTLPQRLLTEPAKTGPAKGLVNEPAQDAAQVLRGARLGSRRAAEAGDARASWPLSRGSETAKRARAAPPPGRCAGFAPEVFHEARHPGQRPGRGHRRRDHPQARARRRDHGGRRRAGAPRIRAWRSRIS